MRLSDTLVKNLFIIIAFFSIIVSQASASPKEVNVDEKGSSESNWFSDLNINDADVYSVNFENKHLLSNLNTGVVSLSKKINAIHKLDNGNYLLSTDSHITVGGVKYESGDLFEYNSITGQSSLYFSGDLFEHKEDVDAVYVRTNGNIVMSTKADARLGGVSFGKADIVEYNPSSDSLTVLVNGGIFGKGDVQSVHVLENGDIVFSIQGVSSLGGLKVDMGDFFSFDPITSSISWAANFGDVKHGAAIEGFTADVPEPATIMFLMAGALALFGNRGKKRWN